MRYNFGSSYGSSPSCGFPPMRYLPLSTESPELLLKIAAPPAIGVAGTGSKDELP
jgi:hypothetical protein